MVCKKSLYCWKNGPCASFQIRKKIWEDNIKFRESLRNVNQSDHYWSFQISKNLCLCQDNEEIFCRKPFSSASLHNLHDSDCTSIAHDCNGLKYRNCLVHCPFQSYRKVTENENNVDVEELQIKKQDSLTPNQCQFLQKVITQKPELINRDKNILLDSSLKPSMKKKYASQSNLSVIDNFKMSTSACKKSLNLSCEDVNRATNNVCGPLKSLKKIPLQKKDISKTAPEVKKEKTKCKIAKEFNPPVQFIKGESLFKCDAPLSRTTRKILRGNRKAPFLPSGCNSNSNDIGAKKTHNVLASRLEVYPNALSAQEQKQKLILRNIQCEKEIQKKCFSEKFRKEMVNHSSLWSKEVTGKENKLLQQKNTKKILPTLSRNTKKLCAVDSQVKSKAIRASQKPHIYFY